MSQKLGFGKHAHLSYSTVLRQYPTYCDWVLDKYQDSNSDAMYDFGVWLDENTSTEPAFDAGMPQLTLPNLSINLSFGATITTIPRGDFGRTLTDGDLIDLRIADQADANTVTFLLAIAPRMWAKKIVIIADRTYELHTDANNTITLDSVLLDGATLEFWKPKFLGIWRHVYNLSDLLGFAGKRVEFKWMRD